MQKITNIIIKGKKENSTINLYWVLEWGKQIDMMVIANHLVLPIFWDGKQPFSRMYFGSQDDYEITGDAVTELQALWVTNW